MDLLCEIADQLKAVNYLTACGSTSLDPERKNATKAMLEIALRCLMAWVVLQSWV